MPTDGTLLLEHMPNGKQHLVTALSVFFSFGSVLAAVAGLIIIPSRSCPPLPAPCDVDTQNQGWKYLFVTLGVLTLAMFLARIAFFRLHESPRYLVHAGRHQEAVESLQLISKFNGSELTLNLEDVQDHHDHGPIANADNENPVVSHAQSDRSPQDSTSSRALRGHPSREGLRNSGDSSPPDYSSIGETNIPTENQTYQTPTRASVSLSLDIEREEDDYKGSAGTRTPSPVSHVHADVQRYLRRRDSGQSRVSVVSLSEVKSKMYWGTPRWIRRPLVAWFDRIAMVLAPEWLRTTLVVWVTWTLMSLGASGSP